MAKKISKLEFDRRVAIITVVIAALGLIATVLANPAVLDRFHPPSPPPITAIKITPVPETQIRSDASDGLQRENADPSWLRERQASADAAAVEDDAAATAETAIH